MLYCRMVFKQNCDNYLESLDIFALFSLIQNLSCSGVKIFFKFLRDLWPLDFQPWPSIGMKKAPQIEFKNWSGMFYWNWNFIWNVTSNGRCHANPIWFSFKDIFCYWFWSFCIFIFLHIKEKLPVFCKLLNKEGKFLLMKNWKLGKLFFSNFFRSLF